MEDIASIGIRLDTDGVTGGIKALDALANQGPRVEASMGKLEQASGRTSKSLANLGQGAGQGLAKVGREAEQAAAGINKMESATASASSELANLGKSVLGFLSVREFVRAADAVTTLQNQLKLATGSATAAAEAYGQLFEIAQRSRVNFAELGGTFASITRASETLKLSQQQILGLTETIANAITVSGSSAQASQAALVQLGQGLASGVLRGEELNSIMEQTPRLAKALADGLGVPIGALRELGSEGKLTAEAVIGALRSQSAALAREVQSSTTTVSQSFVLLQNAATVMAGEIDRASGVSKLLGVSLAAAAASMGDFTAALKATNAAGADFELIGEGVSVVLETVAVLGVNTAFVLTGIGRELGGLAAQATALATGHFAEAGAIRDAMVADAERARKEVDALSERILAARQLREQAQRELRALDTRAEDARLGRQAGNSVAALDFSKLVDGATKAKKAVKALGDQFADQRAAAKDWADAFQDFARIQREAESASLGLSKGQARLLEYLQSPGYAKASDSMREINLQQAYAAISAEQFADAQKLAEKAAEDAADAQAKYIAELEKGGDEIAKQVQKLREEEEALAVSAAKHISLAQAIELVAIARLQEQQAAFSGAGNQSGVDAIQREIDKRKELIGLIASKEGREATKKAIDDTEREVERVARSIEQSLTDSLMRGFESGKGFAENLRDTVENMFKSMVLRPVISAIVSPLSVGLSSMLGVGAASAATGAAGGAAGAGLLGAIGLGGLSASSIGSAIGAGFMSTIGGSTIAGGQAAGLLAGGAATGTGFAGMVGAALPWVGGAALLGNALGLFRTTAYKGTSLRGTFGSGDINDYDVTRKSGTLFSGPSWRENNRGESAVSDSVQAAYEQMRMATAGMAEQLGINGDAIRKYTQSLYIDGNGKSPEDMQRLLADAVTSANDALAKFALGTTAYTKEGESASQTLARLSVGLQGVNYVLDELGQSTLSVSLSGGAMADQIAGLFGGLDSFVQTASNYYQAYYSEAERAAKTTEQVTKGLAQYGLSVPATREAYRALVEAQDLTTESGRKSYAELLKLAPAFASVTAETVALTGAADTTAKAMAEAAARAAEAGKRALTGLADDRGGLQAELLRAQGKTSEAAALDLQRTLAKLTEGLNATDAAAATAAQAYNDTLRAQIEAATAASEAQRAAAEQAQAVATQRYGIEGQLLQLQGDTAALRARELAALDPSNRALQERIFALQDEQAAAQAAAQAQAQAAAEAERVKQAAEAQAKAVADQRFGLEGQLLQLQGDTAALRARELAALDESNRALLQRIYALQDEQAAKVLADQAIAKASEEAAARVRALADVLANLGSTRFGLENQLLGLQGNTAEVARRTRERDLAELTKGLSAEDAVRVTAAYDLNAALQQQITDTQAAQQAAKDLAQAQAQAAAEAQRAAEQFKNAWQSVADSIFDEVARIRGLIGGGSASSFAASQSAFAIAAAQARAGDQEAAKLLPGLSQAMLTLAEAQATSLLELQRIRAQAAATLSGVGGSIASQHGLIPKLDTGTNYLPRDMLIQAHEGEAVVPRAYNPAAGGQASGNAELLAEVKALRLKTEAQSNELIKLNARTTQIMDRWELNGLPQERTV